MADWFVVVGVISLWLIAWWIFTAVWAFFFPAKNMDRDPEVFAARKAAEIAKHELAAAKARLETKRITNG